MLNNKVNMFTLRERVEKCTFILMYINVAFLALFMAILTNCMLFLDGIVVLM